MSSERLRRVRRTSAVLAVLARVGTALFVVAFALAFALPDGREALLGMIASHHDEAMPALPATAIAVLFALGAVPFAIIVVAALMTAHLFAQFGRGRIIEPGTGRCLSLIGTFVVVGVLAKNLSRSVAGVYVSVLDGDGSLTLAIGFEEMAALCAGALFIVVGWVLSEAAAIADEHRQIV